MEEIQGKTIQNEKGSSYKKEDSCGVEAILIVSGGTVDSDFAKSYMEKHRFDRIIAADAGLAHCREIGVEPTDILGDFDSLKDRALLEYYKKRDVPLREFPTRKDYTDTHLAVKYAIDLKPETVIVFGGTGTRMDHTLANIGLLEELCRAGISGKIIDAHNEIELLMGKTEKVYARRELWKYFSLLAWSDKVTGIDLEGFSYPLHQAELWRGKSVGVSNELVEEEGTLRLGEGALLVMRTRD